MTSPILLVLLGVISLTYGMFSLPWLLYNPTVQARQQLSCELSGKCLYCEESGRFGYSACRQQSDCATNEVCRSHSNRQDAYCCARATVVVNRELSSINQSTPQTNRNAIPNSTSRRRAAVAINSASTDPWVTVDARTNRSAIAGITVTRRAVCAVGIAVRLVSQSTVIP